MASQRWPNIWPLLFSRALSGNYRKSGSAASFCFVIWLAQTYAALAVDRQDRMLLIASPSKRSIYYAQLPDFFELAMPRDDRPVEEARLLIDGTVTCDVPMVCNEDSNMGLKSPTGIALHQGCNRAMLYVADTGAENIYAYDLSGTWGQIWVGYQQRIKEGIAGVSSLATDGMGNLFYTTPQEGIIWMISIGQLQAGTNDAVALYRAQEFPSVAGPAGIAADNFYLYWANTQGNAQVGTVVRGFERPRREKRNGMLKKGHLGDYEEKLEQAQEDATTKPAPPQNVWVAAADYPHFRIRKGDVVEVTSIELETRDHAVVQLSDGALINVKRMPTEEATLWIATSVTTTIEPLASEGKHRAPEAIAANTDLYDSVAQNVCLARDNVFFTGGTRSLFVVKGNGGTIAEVSKNFQQPSGCTYDDESTLYVADTIANAVFSLPANMGMLRPVRHLSKVVSVEMPTQLAVLSLSAAGGCELPRAPPSAARPRALGRIAVVLATLIGVLTV